MDSECKMHSESIPSLIKSIFYELKFKAGQSFVLDSIQEVAPHEKVVVQLPSIMDHDLLSPSGVKITPPHLAYIYLYAKIVHIRC